MTPDPAGGPAPSARPGDDGGDDGPPRPEIAPGLVESVAAAGDGGGAGDETGAGAGLLVDVSDPDAEALAALPLAARVEAALFAATEPLQLKRLREVSGCPDAQAVRDAVAALARDYEAAGRAFRIEEVAQGYQLRTTERVACVVARLGRRAADERLSTAALETLAVVAYRQPVLRADVERIRGVACGEVLRALQERALVRVAGRADLPGAPLLYGTTQRFLELFGLRDLRELPQDRDLLRPRDAGAAPSAG